MSAIPARSQVSISGTVLDSRTKAPVAGANVKLIGLNFLTVTDADGLFSLSGTSLLNPNTRHQTGAPVIDKKSLLYKHNADGTALIRILDLSGRQRALVFNGELAKGYWRITPPLLSAGIYLFSFETTNGIHAIRYLAQAPFSGTAAGTMQRLPESDDNSYSSTIAKQNAASVSVDSLLVTKTGYRAAHVAITTFQQTEINILLEDTTASTTSLATIIPDPSWTCFMPDGIPPPELGTKVFSITLKYSAIYDVGITKFGHRRQFDIKGGTIKGDRIDGTVLTGGLDYELILSNGSTELEQINILRASNIPILMRNAGVAPAGSGPVRVVLDFEAPNSSSFTWLNTGKFAANRIVDSAAKTISLDVYDISKITLPETHIQIKDPTDVVNQTWECVKLTGSQGTTVFTENVSLGSSISIGASKRGSRNIIPITGGTTTGRVVGKILNGGADYQLSGLDARYTLAPNDGEFIVVRNCGSGGLVPVFEARVDGPYAFLNENKYLSSQPGMSGGGVSITFYERK
jgi:hypothetical protein